jgi:geranylgeranylglycerol-phosphate geranylgeranyltransferase
MNSFVSLLRPNVCLLSAIGMIVGFLVIGSFELMAIPAIIAAFIITGAGNVINDVFDIEIDKINQPKRPLSSGKIKKKTAVYYFLILNVIGLAISIFISTPFFMIALINSIVLFVYSWKFKRTLLIGNIFVSWLAASTFLAAALVFSDFAAIPVSIILLSAISFLGTMSRELFKSIEDMKGDKADGAKTLPIIIGESSSRVAALIFLWIGVFSLFVPVFKNIFSIFYFIGVVPAIILCVYATISSVKDEWRSAQKAVKYAMFLVMLGYILGSVF